MHHVGPRFGAGCDEREKGLFGGGVQADATMTHATLSLSDRDIRQVATEHARQQGALQGIVPVTERGVQDVARDTKQVVDFAEARAHPAQGQLGGRILEVGDRVMKDHKLVEVGVKLLVHLFTVPNHGAQHLKAVRCVRGRDKHGGPRDCPTSAAAVAGAAAVRPQRPRGRLGGPRGQPSTWRRRQHCALP